MYFREKMYVSENESYSFQNKSIVIFYHDAMDAFRFNENSRSNSFSFPLGNNLIGYSKDGNTKYCGTFISASFIIQLILLE